MVIHTKATFSTRPRPNHLILRENLTPTERSDYINATLCLMRAPAKQGIKGAKTRWDELQYIHIVQSDYIHFVVRQEKPNRSGRD